MTNIEEAAHRLAEIINRHRADYIEAHLEESQSTCITYRGKELESIGKTSSVGGNVRALAKGGWGFVSFNSLDDLPGRVALAVKQAELAGGKKSKLAPVEPAVDTVLTEADSNPAAIPLAKKKLLLDEYNDIIWAVPKIQT
ncbi:MAG: TldD/PmbA family protein, partial [Dehalococcoidia bacterium]|nr:TldD/PmbA family protein [Dehalococcoidia bacterium]